MVVNYNKHCPHVSRYAKKINPYVTKKKKIQVKPAAARFLCLDSPLSFADIFWLRAIWSARLAQACCTWSVTQARLLGCGVTADCWLARGSTQARRSLYRIWHFFHWIGPAEDFAALKGNKRPYTRPLSGYNRWGSLGFKDWDKPWSRSSTFPATLFVSFNPPKILDFRPNKISSIDAMFPLSLQCSAIVRSALMLLALWVIPPRRHESRLQVASLSDNGEKGRLTWSPGPHFHTNHFVIRGIVSRVRYSSSIESSTRAISTRSFLPIFDRDVCDRLRDEVERLKNPFFDSCWRRRWPKVEQRTSSTSCIIIWMKWFA